MKNKIIFSTKALSVGYNGRSLIRNIDISLEKGKILTLIGPNGSGKSTILKTIAKYLATISGTVYIDDKSIDSMNELAIARKLSVVLTQRLKTELMTCKDVVETGRYPYTGRLGILSNEDKAQVHEAMALTNTLLLSDDDFSAISDGQRQRVMLARAICQQPEIIVLDEPTSFLDVRYELELLKILRSLAEERGITVIMSLHELDLAERVSDYILCVKGETIEHFGTAEEIFRGDLITKLYDIKDGSYDPLFGSLEMQRPKGEAKTFVIAGGGEGIRVYRALQKKHIPFITGILHENDIDNQVAKALASEAITEEPFQRISDATYVRALEKLSSCERVINCLKCYGEMNEANRALFEKAKEMGKVIDEA